MIDDTAARGIARRVCRETAPLVTFARTAPAVLRRGSNGSWARALLSDIRRAAGEALVETVSDKRASSAALLLPVDVDYRPLASVSRNTRLGGLGLAVIQIDRKRRAAELVVCPFRFSQHALARLIERAQLSNVDEVLRQVGPVLVTLLYENQQALDIQAGEAVTVVSPTGLAIVRREELGAVVATVILANDMSAPKLAYWKAAQQQPEAALADS